MSLRSSAVRSPVSAAMRGAFRSGLSTALVVSAVGAVLVAMAPVLPVVHAEDGASTSPAYPAWPLLAVLALAPVVLAGAFAVRGRVGASLAVLVAVGALAPARALVDLQLVVQPWWAARPELLVPTSLAPLHAGFGAWALVLGHVAMTAGGVLAVAAARRGGPAGGAPRQPALTAALCAGVVAAAGLMAAPFTSTDPYLLSQPAVDAPALVMVGTLLLAAGVVLVGWLAAGAADPDVAFGALLGTAVVIAAVALPAVVAATLSPALSLSWGPLAALAGAAALAWLSGSIRRGVDAAERGSGVEHQLRLPALDRLQGVAGVLAIVAGSAALAGAASSQVLVPPRSPVPVIYSARLLVPAGLLVLALGVVLVAGWLATGLARPAGLLRPALAVCWAAMALATAAVLDAALAATRIVGVRAGPGAWAAAVALLAALAAAAVAAVAGTVERDEVDLSQPRSDPVLMAVGGLAAALAVPAFGLPVLAAPGFSPAGLWSNFGVASWGLLAALVAVAGAALLAPWSRASRAVGLLLGAFAVVGVHLAQLPLTGGRARADTSVAAGAWFGVACAVALLTACWWAWRRERREHRATMHTKYPAEP